MKITAVFALLSAAVMTKVTANDSSEPDLVRFSNAKEKGQRRLTHCDPIQGNEVLQDLCSTVGAGEASGTVGTIVVQGGFPDVIYKFGGPGFAGSTFLFSTCNLVTNDLDTGISIWDSPDPAAPFAYIECQDDYCGWQSQLEFTVPDDSFYYARVGGFAGSSGSTQISWTSTTPCSTAVSTAGPESKDGVSMGDPHFKVIIWLFLYPEIGPLCCSLY